MTRGHRLINTDTLGNTGIIQVTRCPTVSVQAINDRPFDRALVQASITRD